MTGVAWLNVVIRSQATERFTIFQHGDAQQVAADEDDVLRNGSLFRIFAGRG